MATLVTMELYRVPRPRVPAAAARMLTDRGRLAATPGLRFWKLLGTGDGRTFNLRDTDLRTWAVLGVWEDAADAERYSAGSPVAKGWRRLAEEAWRADLRPLTARGRWSGNAPFGAPPAPGRVDGPVAAITRARLRTGRVRRFRRAVPPVTGSLRQQPGLRLSIGIGEAPVGLQGTFSVWASVDDLLAFAYRQAPHRAVVTATPREGWYAEELFARFAVVRTRGTICGRDPAADPPVSARSPAPGGRR